MTLGKKEGLATKEEIKILWDLADDLIPIPGWLKPIVSITVPGIIDGMDNKVGDRIPEPWQTYCEDLITMTVEAAKDKKFTIEECEAIASYAAKVVDEKIDVPLLEDDIEAIMFLEIFRLLATSLYGMATKEKAKILNV